jgi:hypothetical protein
MKRSTPVELNGGCGPLPCVLARCHSCSTKTVLPFMIRNLFTICVVVLLAACDKPQEELKLAVPIGSGLRSLALEGEGLRVFDAPSGNAQPIALGTGKTETLGLLEKVIGNPPLKQGENPDCGATNAVWSNGLVTWFQANRLVGWSVSLDLKSSLRTADGIGLGTTRAELDNSGTVVKVFDSSLGTEFSAGDMAGLLNSPNKDGIVTNLWAGQVCIAR